VDWCWQGPTSAQFFNFADIAAAAAARGGWFGNEQRGGGWFGNEQQRGGGSFGTRPFAPYQQQYAPPPRYGRQAPAVREDFKAPPPEKAQHCS